jgi:catechol 2,3-dioxygenase-like lactoylglutathione lyase family enzyme
LTPGVDEGRGFPSLEASMSVTSICGVILTTSRMTEMVAFYSNVLGLPLEKEEHGDLEVHYGTDFANQIHFALHPPSDFKLGEPGNASAKIAFTVDKLDAYVQRMADHGYEPFIAPHDEGFGPVAAFRDPDGNVLELVELRYEFKPG